jgi:hypothetical protein
MGLLNKLAADPMWRTFWSHRRITIGSINMKRTFWSSFAIILLVFNFILIGIRFDSIKRIKNLQIQLAEQAESKGEDKDLLAWYSLLYETIGKRIDPTIELKNVNYNTVGLKEIINSEGIWILRFFENNCQSCYDENISIIRDFMNRLRPNSFVVFTNFDSINELRNFVSKTHFACETYNTGSLFSFTSENLQVPYLLQIDKTGLITSCFIIQKDQGELLKKFLQISFHEKN